LKYAEYTLNSIANILLYQAEDFIYASFQLYDDILLDVPVIEDYRFSKDSVDEFITSAEYYLELAAAEIRSVKQLGGVWIEQMIRESMGEEISKGFNPTQAAPITVTTTQAPTLINAPINWLQEMLSSITG